MYLPISFVLTAAVGSWSCVAGPVFSISNLSTPSGSSSLHSASALTYVGGLPHSANLTAVATSSSAHTNVATSHTSSSARSTTKSSGGHSNYSTPTLPTNTPASITWSYAPSGHNATSSNASAASAVASAVLSYSVGCDRPNWCDPDQPSCCLVPCSEHVPSCLWKLMGDKGSVLKGYLDQNQFDGDNWVENLMRLYGLSDTCTILLGCKFTLPIPDGTNDKVTIIKYLGLKAIRRFMLYQSANHIIMKESLDGFVEYRLNDVVAGVSKWKNDPPPDDSAWPAIRDGMGILAALLGMIAAPMSGPAAIALKLAQGGLGIEGGIINLVDGLGRPTVESTKDGLKAYFADCRVTLTKTIEAKLYRTVHELPFAFQQMEASGGADIWFKSTDEPLWSKPWDTGQSKFIALLSAWAASKALQRGKIFLHVEQDHSHGDAGFPGERWLDIPGGMTANGQGLDILAFPVAFNLKPPNHQNTYDGRYYGPGLDYIEKDLGIAFEHVIRSSYACRAKYRPGDFGSIEAPELDIASIGDIDLNTIDSSIGNVIENMPCMFSLHVCNPEWSNVLNRCVDEQHCCTGHENDNLLHTGYGYLFQWNVWNFGMDSWCSKTLGTGGLGFIDEQCT